MTLIFEYGTVSVLGHDVTEESFSVYPNPFSNSFSVSIKNINTSELTMTNILGEVVYKQEVSAGTRTVNTEKLISGIYFVNLKTENGVITKKIIKE